ncbi:flagellar hook-length control protein FliK [Vibrio nereis]|uniref:flagellar hook-length control protein FliK n=1 Tax=Vibrio nereis TaxID=693 RepID=UPI002493FFEA|nr:flagellar hook-length control protein FliK [Vibrio nereis]
MNINLSVATDNPKATKPAAESTDVAGEGEVVAPEGFLSKLVAFVKGDSEQSEKEVISLSGANVGESAETGEAQKSVDTKQIENTETDELLVEQKDISGEADEAQIGAKPASSAPVSSEQSDSKSAESIVADSEQVLKRLNDANNALQPNDGKALPQASVSEEGDVKEAAVQKIDKVASDNQSTLSDGEQPKPTSQPRAVTEGSKIPDEPQSASDSVVIPESAKRFIQQQEKPQSDEQAPELVKDTEASEAITPAMHSNNSVSPGEANLAEDEKGEKSERPMTVSADKLENSDQHLSTEASDGVEQVNSEFSPNGVEKEAIAKDVVNVSEVENSTEIDKLRSSQELPPHQTAVNTPSDKSAAQTANLVEDTEPETEQNAPAIPWSVNNSDAVTEETLTQAAVQTKDAQTSGTSPSATAVNSSQLSKTHAPQVVLQNNMANSAPLPDAVNTTPPPQLANTVASAAPAVTEQALLKASLGAKAAASLVGKSLDKAETGQGGESTFAHQLAQAAGVQQNAPTGTQPRVEQANAQIPLQLNREMASDQVAERVQMMLSKNLKNIDIRLDPPELGRMQIRMNMNGDGATVHFTVANQQARDALEQSMPRLREMLAQQGVQLGDTSVQQQSSNQQQNRYAAGGQPHSGQGGSNQSGMAEENLEADINLDLNVAAKRDGISYYA